MAYSHADMNLNFVNACDTIVQEIVLEIDAVWTSSVNWPECFYQKTNQRCEFHWLSVGTGEHFKYW